MTPRRDDKRLDFEKFRGCIERCDPDGVLGFYADDARLVITNAGLPQTPFELRGKAEISKHLRAVFGQKASHRVGREVVGDERIAFREVCEYPDGGRVVVETTLQVQDGEIVRQVDVATKDAAAAGGEEAGGGTRPGTGATPHDRPAHPERATEKESLG
jgi:hypothetical protein